mmetsp:Transcript_10630/g.44274  ORF Transcript_10630/g.44274 Transcript_10630/m.44274 type:complete len:87 (-) Transcript_10630:987-1247(-)
MLSSASRFNEWLGTLPHRNKIVIGGNMDFALGRMSKAEADDALSNAIYLQDSQVEIDGYVFYGSPFTPEVFLHLMATIITSPGNLD